MNKQIYVSPSGTAKCIYRVSKNIISNSKCNISQFTNFCKPFCFLFILTGFPPKLDYYFPWAFQVFQTMKCNFSEYIYTYGHRRNYALTLPFKCDLYLFHFPTQKITHYFKLFARFSSFALGTIHKFLEEIVIIVIARNFLRIFI